jgi:tripartite-type tricarboxylate transporter receptor subunit TctC
MVQALLANDIQLAIATLGGNLPHVRSGRLRLLAVTARSRIAESPETPTTPEAGFPDLIASNWWALAAPRGTDARIVERLTGAVRGALADPAARKRLADLGMIPVGSTSAELASHMRAEAARWKAVIERGHIKVQ